MCDDATQTRIIVTADKLGKGKGLRDKVDEQCRI
jgi:hypothetical protein